ncbi:type II toxin-antitoxin system RelE/ParE family toxin [Flavobacterium sp. F-65]|uniref:Type II toxin-antitoxin system RelE/ParE family toxin n=1 Tax=Flavobacterium pisciphilum TaxID=2893755 RepID=A0ABS8MML8_9FLAO|nr:type II toxin-antitoxin system RelE/ParE family toxin [Flavobacterium sp. F-65]MCC9070008.1 type II toxin-antitoxin system RelE/ParE family toxin [Flavobacterium sp. F-65]
MEVVWTLKAEKTYLQNCEYLLENWNLEVATKFDSEVLRVIDLISKNPYLGRYNNDFKCSIILIVKQISLFYTIYKGKITLMYFHDNRQKKINFEI